MFVEVQSPSKTLPGAAVNENLNQQVNVLQQIPFNIEIAKPVCNINPTFNNCVVHFNVHQGQ